MVGNGSTQNRGCEAILRGTAEILASVYPDYVATNLYFASPASAADPESEGKRISDRVTECPLPERERRSRASPYSLLSAFGLSGLGHEFGYVRFRQFELRLAQVLPSADVALELGGDNYTLDYGPPLVHASIDRVTAKQGIPVVIWAASVGPFLARPSIERWMLEHFRRYVRAIIAREPGTFDYLRSRGVSTPLFLMHDPAFVMKAQRPSTTECLEDLPPRAIGLNLSPLIGRYIGGSRHTDRWLQEAARLIEGVVRKIGRPVVLIPHVTKKGNDDHYFMAQARALARVPAGAVYLLPRTLSAPETKWVISSLDLLVASRMHATIAGLSCAVPTLSIAYSAKQWGLNEAVLGHSRFVVAARACNADHVIQQLSLVSRQSGEIRDQLRDTIPALEAGAYEGGSILRSILGA